MILMRIYIMATCILIVRVCVVSAQSTQLPNPCSPCKQAVIPWNAVKLTQKLVTIGRCTYMVTYRTRTCNSDGCQELKLEKIRKFAGTNCGADSTADISTLILGKMVSENTMGFKPDSVSTGSNGCWRIIRPACWRMNFLPACPGWPTPGPFNPDVLRYNPGDILPCDTADCCTNVIYPTKDQCGNILYSTPGKHDLAWIHGFRDKWRNENPPLGSIDSQYVKARDAFVDQYNSSLKPFCAECPVTIPDVLTPPRCRRHCPEDLILEYKRLLNERAGGDK